MWVGILGWPYRILAPLLTALALSRQRVQRVCGTDMGAVICSQAAFPGAFCARGVVGGAGHARDLRLGRTIRITGGWEGQFLKPKY